MRRTQPIIVICASLWLAASSAGAFFEKIPIRGAGARPLGMGGAFTALANEADTAWWNPAGIGQLTHVEISSMYARVFNRRISYLFSSIAVPLALPIDWTMGLSWERLSFTDSPNKLKEDVYYATFGFPIPTPLGKQNLFAGLNVKFFNASSSFPSVGARGLGLDGGILFRATLPKYGGKEIRFGLSVQDITTEIKEDFGVTQTVPRGIRLGAAYLPFHWFTLTADYEDQGKDPSIVSGENRRLRAGVENWLWGDRVAARLGFVRQLGVTSPTSFSMGVSFMLQGLRFDYALLRPTGTSPASQRVSFSYIFGRKF